MSDGFHATHHDEPDIDLDITPLSYDILLTSSNPAEVPSVITSGACRVGEILDDLTPVPVPEVRPSAREIDRQDHQATRTEPQRDGLQKCPSIRCGDVFDDTD